MNRKVYHSPINSSESLRSDGKMLLSLAVGLYPTPRARPVNIVRIPVGTAAFVHGIEDLYNHYNQDALKYVAG